ncbi:RmlC-like cupin domain-containing protein [Phellopilus nigrolimitatus]|nr:RmlC-like cupin domain-containing protein [Phellopilus nigrolimitatus]
MFNARFLSFLVFASMTMAAPAVSNSSSSALVESSSVAHTVSVPSSSSSVSSAPSEAQTVTPASDASNYPVWSQDTDDTPEAINGALGNVVAAPDDIQLDQQNPDLLAPPTTDNGLTQNAKWPFALSHNRTPNRLPIATKMASVQMSLEPGAIRELHWHTSAEWSYVLKGTTVVTAVDADGCVYVDAAEEGDLWYFPPGLPHSLQATDDDPDGSEFLLVFDDGTFSEDSTFQLTDWTAHIPKEVLAKNFQMNMSAFDHIPSEELYIFPSTPPPNNEQAPSDPAGTVPNPFTYKLSKASATPLSGGTIKVFDPSVFKVANTIVGALVTWHPTQPEWDYFITGQARMTLFASGAVANTFDYRVRYVPPVYGHYIENTGNTTLKYLELFNSDKVQDISLQQWLALTPPQLVKAHLGVDDAMIAHLNKTKQTVVGPAH